MQKTLEKLGEEYLESAELINSLIKKYRKILKESYDSGNYLKTYDTKRKLTIFYDQKRELKAIGNKLIHYYEKEDDSDELYKNVSQRKQTEND